MSAGKGQHEVQLHSSKANFWSGSESECGNRFEIKKQAKREAANSSALTKTLNVGRLSFLHAFLMHFKYFYIQVYLKVKSGIKSVKFGCINNFWSFRNITKKILFQSLNFWNFGIWIQRVTCCFLVKCTNNFWVKIISTQFFFQCNTQNMLNTSKFSLLQIVSI